VQRCPSNPQEKRSTGTGEEIKTPNSKKENKGIKRRKRPRRNKSNQIKRKGSKELNKEPRFVTSSQKMRE